MSVKLRMEPLTPPVAWEEFIRRYPTRSIALDGYVYGPPQWRSEGGQEHASLNHHESVDRYATRATCAQVLMAIRLGIFSEGFRDKSGDLDILVYANDCDEDVCLSMFLLSHYEMVKSPVNPLINRLVHMEDMLDATAGAYIYPVDGSILHEIAWIFQPYHTLRLNNGLGRRNWQEFQMVVDDVDRRIMAYITGNGRTLSLATDYRIIEQYGKFAIIEEMGAQCRTKMYSDGITSFLAAKQRTADCYDYKIGKMSPYIKLNIVEAIKRLNEAEGLTDNPDQWGGGDTIGGSPRIAGSKLTPYEAGEIIRSCTHAGETVTA